MAASLEDYPNRCTSSDPETGRLQTNETVRMNELGANRWGCCRTCTNVWWRVHVACMCRLMLSCCLPVLHILSNFYYIGVKNTNCKTNRSQNQLSNCHNSSKCSESGKFKQANLNDTSHYAVLPFWQIKNPQNGLPKLHRIQKMSIKKVNKVFNKKPSVITILHIL